MPNYEYRFKNAKTGRWNRRARWAFDEDELRQQLAAEGVSPEEVTQLPDEPATERQKEYMVALGIVFPHDVTKAGSSDLISNFHKRRSPANARDFDLAREMRVEVSPYASKASIYRSILYALQQRGNGEELAAWYAYRVYRDAHDRSGLSISDPHDPRFVAIGRKVASDPALLASLRRAAQSSETNFRYFGRFVTPDGLELQGDSVRTAVYRFVFGELLAVGLLSGSRRQAATSVGEASGVAQQAGCLQNGLVSLGTLVAIVLIGFFVLR